MAFHSIYVSIDLLGSESRVLEASLGGAKSRVKEKLITNDRLIRRRARPQRANHLLKNISDPPIRTCSTGEELTEEVFQSCVG